MGVGKAIANFVTVPHAYIHCVYSRFSHLCIMCTCAYIPVVTAAPVSSETIVPTATSTSLTLRPSASAETAAGERIS